MFIKTPAKGMRDILPRDLILRERVLDIIARVYRSYGFNRIETPCVEDINLLLGKEGGENEKLIFKILKRGEKLVDADNGEICDYGLRYDLTVPLTRYYTNNIGVLPTVFKAMQIGNVWRAERPQKGRFRQFMQCDIDIIGEESNLAETELICATTDALSAIGFKGFTVKVNDRRILKALALFAGFDENKHTDVFIALDKLDKIGEEGVRKELIDNNLDINCINKLMDATFVITKDKNPLEKAEKLLCDYLDVEVVDGLKEIFQTVMMVVNDCHVQFDMSLVRGMNYYTGTIFEIVMDGVGYSVAGGGRYDNLIGHFTGKSVAACGFSIGFERIINILMEQNAFDNDENSGIIYIISKNAPVDKISKVYLEAKEARIDGRKCSVMKKMKNFKLQLDEAVKDNYCEAFVLNEDGEIKHMILK
ncbi:MAG: histidine--tRNA ligase [Clostridia bacterium]